MANDVPATNVAPRETIAAKTFTVRELIAKLVMAEDLDAEVYLSIRNSDPIPVNDVEDTSNNQVVLSGKI